MGAMASQITSLTIVYSTVYSGSNQRKHQSSTSLAFVRGIHRWPVNSPHKGPVTRKMFPFGDVIIQDWHFDGITGREISNLQQNFYCWSLHNCQNDFQCSQWSQFPQNCGISVLNEYLAYWIISWTISLFHRLDYMWASTDFRGLNLIGNQTIQSDQWSTVPFHQRPFQIFLKLQDWVLKWSL